MMLQFKLSVYRQSIGLVNSGLIRVLTFQSRRSPRLHDEEFEPLATQIWLLDVELVFLIAVT